MNDFPFTLSADRPPQLGLIVLQEDETIEVDIRRLLPDEVELLVSRIPSGAEVTPQTLAAMERDMAAAAGLLPAGAALRAVGYGCTSGTAQIGAARVAELVRAGIRTDHVTDPVTALIAACKYLGLRRIAMVSPYMAPVSERLRQVLSAHGVTVSAFATFNVPQEATVVRIDPSAIQDAAIETAAQAPCDGVFMSCTNLRTLKVIEPVEAALNRPVLSSNLVLSWHMLRVAGLTAGTGNPGRLWRADPVGLPS